MDAPFGIRRSRVAWLGLTAVLGLLLSAIVVAFVGTFALGLFFYYAVRPAFRQLQRRIGSRSIAASLTLLFVVGPGMVLVGYVGLIAFQELTAFAGPEVTRAIGERVPTDPELLEAVVDDPLVLLERLQSVSGVGEVLLTGVGAVGTVANGMLHVTLASALAYFLLRDGHRLESWFRESIGGADSSSYTFLRTVDAELEQVYFGNVLTVCLVALGAIVFYNGYNLVVPAAVAIPAPTLIAILTGVATFIPLVVGKIVYVPTGLVLFWQASQADPSPYWAPVVFLVVAFLFLDLLPMTFLLPYISGRTLHTGLIMFSYVLGGAYFGWYGLFLGPLIAVVLVQFGKIVLPEIIRGEPVDPQDGSAIDIGLQPLLGGDEPTADDANPEARPTPDREPLADGEPPSGDDRDGGPSTVEGDPDTDAA